MKKILKSALVQAGLAWLTAGYVAMALRCQRWQVVGENYLDIPLNEPVIAALWHEALALGSVLRLVTRRRGMRRDVVALASQHRDGKLIGNAMRHLGLELVLGSSSRGGGEAVAALSEAIRGGKHVVLTPDGPRGPRRRAAPGVVWLAARTGAPILPYGVWTSRAITLKSWDRMRIPLPFGRAVLAVGAPIYVTGQGEDALPGIEAAITAMQERAAQG